MLRDVVEMWRGGEAIGQQRGSVHSKGEAVSSDSALSPALKV